MTPYFECWLQLKILSHSFQNFELYLPKCLWKTHNFELINNILSFQIKFHYKIIQLKYKIYNVLTHNFVYFIRILKKNHKLCVSVSKMLMWHPKFSIKFTILNWNPEYWAKNLKFHILIVKMYLYHSFQSLWSEQLSSLCPTKSKNLVHLNQWILRISWWESLDKKCLPDVDRVVIRNPQPLLCLGEPATVHTGISLVTL